MAGRPVQAGAVLASSGRAWQPVRPQHGSVRVSVTDRTSGSPPRPPVPRSPPSVVGLRPRARHPSVGIRRTSPSGCPPRSQPVRSGQR